MLRTVRAAEDTATAEQQSSPAEQRCADEQRGAKSRRRRAPKRRRLRVQGARVPKAWLVLDAEAAVLGPLSQQRIAEVLGCSRARVVQIEQLALAKLRRLLAREWSEP